MPVYTFGSFPIVPTTAERRVDLDQPTGYGKPEVSACNEMILPKTGIHLFQTSRVVPGHNAWSDLDFLPEVEDTGED